MITADTYHDEAKLYMLSRGKIDGGIGVQLTRLDQQAWQWICYLQAKGLKSASSFARERVSAGKTYHVPAAWPADFDPTWSSVRCPPMPRSAADLPADQREAIVERFATKPHERRAPESDEVMV